MHYLGIDISKAKLDCCLLLEENKRHNKVVSNTEKGIIDLLTWLGKQGACLEQLHAIIEGTGVYHQNPAYALHKAGIIVSIVNPSHIKNFGKGIAIRTKTDTVDSLVLARYGALVKPAAWEPPPAHVRALEALLARREAVAQDLLRERNRLEKTEIIETMPIVAQSLLDSITFLEHQLKWLDKEINDHINHHPDLKDDYRLLTSIPAVGSQVGKHLLCVMHKHTFRRAEQVAAYLGVIPVERQSGSSVRGRPKMSKAGPAHIRAILYMASITAIRYNPHVSALYARLLGKGKSKMSAIGAAMRKLVHLCFGVLKTRQPYQHAYVKVTGLT